MPLRALGGLRLHFSSLKLTKIQSLGSQSHSNCGQVYLRIIFYASRRLRARARRHFSLASLAKGIACMILHRIFSRLRRLF